MEPQKASLIRRALALIIDGILIGIISLPIAYVFTLFEPTPILIRVDGLFNVIVILAYLIGFTYKLNGYTPGKKLLKIRVVSMSGDLTIRQIAIRFVVLEALLGLMPAILALNFFGAVGGILTMILVISYVVVMIWDKQNRAIHDFAAGTWVVSSIEKA